MKLSVAEYWHYVNWLNSRQVQLRVLVMQLHMMKVQALIDASVLRRVKKVEIGADTHNLTRYTSEMETAARTLLSRCRSSVEELSILISQNDERYFELVMDQLLALPVPHPQLRVFLCPWQEDIRGSSLQGLVSAIHATLEQLLVGSVSITVEQVHLLHTCKNVHTLEFDRRLLSAEEIAEFIDGFPRLKNLTVRCRRHFSVYQDDEEGSGFEGLTPDEVVELAPHFAHLRTLEITSKHLKSWHTFYLLAEACPHLERLQTAPHLAEFHAVDHGYALTARLESSANLSADLYMITMYAMLKACPKPVVELSVDYSTSLALVAGQVGSTLRAFRPTGSMTAAQHMQSWTLGDLQCFFETCVLLRSLELRECSKKWNDEALKELARNCPFLAEITMSSANCITDEGMGWFLEFSGGPLTKLVLSKCKKISKPSLQAIAQHCGNLQQLTLDHTAITTSDIVQILMRPDCLQDLRKLELEEKAYLGIFRDMLLAEDVPRRWRTLVHSTKE